MGNKCETGNVKRFFLLLLGSFLSLSAWAQTGVICGTVSDAKFKDALIGASVVIEGTTVGAIADVEGNFRIENVKPGKYTIVASYVSYKSETIRDVVVKAHQESVLRIELSDADLQLQNVVVVAQRKLGTETAIINTVRKSLPVVSGISAQQIGKTQDSDAAEVLRRIPGLTIVDDRFVVVRGLAQRYNNVWLNEATTPSSETDSRAFSFDVLPSSLIDNMMVYKSPSAELPADFSGGFVQVMTRIYRTGIPSTYLTRWDLIRMLLSEFPADGRELEGLSRIWGRGAEFALFFPFSFRGLFDRGSRCLYTADQPEVGNQQVHGYSGPKDFAHFTPISFDAGDWKIGNIANVNWSTGYDYSETVNNNYIAYDVANDLSRPRFEYNDVRYKNTSKLGALFNWSFMKGDHKYEFRNFFSQRGVSALTQRKG